MAYSMTGYGRAESEANGIKFSVEVKSVNHRYLDIVVKMPRTIAYLESMLKQQAMKYVSRGKVEIFVTQDEFGADMSLIKIDDSLADACYQALTLLKQKYDFEDDIPLASFIQIPGVMKVEKREIDEEAVWEALRPTLTSALDALKAMREIEGGNLVTDIRDKLSRLRELLNEVRGRAPMIVDEYRTRLSTRIKELMEQQDISIDENRIAVEVALFADKSSVDEELVRLESHIDQAEMCLGLDEPVGRKLDFITQEMNREVNTIGSKSNDIEVNRNIVEMKSEIEKFREQIQNIE